MSVYLCLSTLQHVVIRDTIADIVPSDSPTWYVVIFGLGSFLGIIGVMASYMRRHGLFLPDQRRSSLP